MRLMASSTVSITRVEIKGPKRDSKRHPRQRTEGINPQERRKTLIHSLRQQLLRSSKLMNQKHRDRVAKEILLSNKFLSWMKKWQQLAIPKVFRSLKQ
jgi:hypothetical protein